jgi:hypothetical protein
MQMRSCLTTECEAVDGVVTGMGLLCWAQTPVLLEWAIIMRPCGRSFIARRAAEGPEFRRELLTYLLRLVWWRRYGVEWMGKDAAMRSCGVQSTTGPTGGDDGFSTLPPVWYAVYVL